MSGVPRTGRLVRADGTALTAVLRIAAAAPMSKPRLLPRQDLHGVVGFGAGGGYYPLCSALPH